MASDVWWVEDSLFGSEKHAEKILKSARKLQSTLGREELGWWFMNDAFGKQDNSQHAFTAGLARVIDAAELMMAPDTPLSIFDDTLKSGLGGISATIAAHLVPIFEKHFGQQAKISTDWAGEDDPKGAIIGFVQAASRELKLFPKCPEPETIATAVNRLRALRKRLRALPKEAK